MYMRRFFSFYSRDRYTSETARLAGTINLFYSSIHLYIFVFVLAVRLIVIDSVTELTVRRILTFFRRACRYNFWKNELEALNRTS